ncbi:MAG: Glu-tRNA(Gln) amidotransferase subunit GatE [Thermoanaerobaculales bacterium]|nr:Glu-tRNA(Gln) amidotransferase subunit GatE [Thermoanaerobaculales bacterium]
MQQSIDYTEIGLIAGLEVHQQLLTKTKLFCRCPSGLYTTEHDGTVLRHMRPTLSELGEYDGTALMEFKTKKNIIYLLHESNTCTYETDDTPPFLINQEAVDVAIEQCLMLGCDIVDELHIARKQYLDGSIPTGFQRTAIVGVNGRLPFRGRELSITQVSVEEDSCREVSDNGHLIVWRTDRLGVPLIETVTGPDLRTPDEVEEAILLVGRVCRSTGHVRVGLGASRQDVNVSVRGGTRVEIKGVPKAGWAPALVHGEAIRQVNLLQLRDELHQRGIKSPEAITIDHRDVTRILASSEIDFFRLEGWDRFNESHDRREGFESGKGPFSVRAVRLKSLRGTLEHPTQPDLTFAHELQGRVRVISGLDQPPIMVHDGSWPGAAAELKALRSALHCEAEDALAVIWGAEEDTLTAAEEIRLRFADATLGVPAETRQPFADGHTNFERILPGPDRMYPDTDSPPLALGRDRVAALQEKLAEPPWEREERYSAAGLPRNTIHFLIRRGGARLVDLVVNEAGADLRSTGFFFGERLKGLRRAGLQVDDITDEQWLSWFRLMSSQPVLAEILDEVVAWMARHLGNDPNAFVEGGLYGSEPKDWRQHLRKIAIGAQPKNPDGSQSQRLAFLMGLVMPNLRGRIPAQEVLLEIDPGANGKRDGQ